MPKRRSRPKFTPTLILFGCIFSLCTAVISAQESCAEMFKSNFFPPKIINKVLHQFEIPPEKWAGINRDLTLLTKHVEERVHRKAERLTPNPFNEPQQTVVIGKLYHEVRMKIFQEVMRQHGVDDNLKIYDMFDQIQYEKASIVWDCYQKEKRG